jgi:hypothetical protein
MKTSIAALAATVWAAAALPVAAVPVTISFTVPPQTGGNKGTSWRPTGADFEVTARWGLSDVNDGANPGYLDNPGTGYYDQSGNPLTSPTPGLVYQDTVGLGVWANRYKSDKGSYVLDHGSDGISGSGPHAKEELIFTFDNPVLLDSIALGLTDLNWDKKKGEWKEDPILYITGSYGSEVGIGENIIASILGPVNSGVLNFSSLGLFSNPNETVSYFRVRNWEEHFEVSSLGYEPYQPPPVPDGGSTLTLLGCAALGLGVVHRRLRRGS